MSAPAKPVAAGQDSFFRRNFFAVIFVIAVTLLGPLLYAASIEADWGFLSDGEFTIGALIVIAVLLIWLFRASGVARIAQLRRQLVDDNPVAGLLATAQRNRRGRRSLADLNFLPLIVFATMAALHAVIWLPQMLEQFNYSDYLMSGGILELVITLLLQLTGVALAPAFLVWLMQGIYFAARDCLGFLAAPNRKRATFCLDESLAVSGLSSREILHGVLLHVFPQMAGMVFGGLLLLVGLSILIPLATQSGHGLEIALAPFNLLVLMLSGGLAALILVLTWLVAGRGVSASVHAGSATLFQLLWTALLGWSIVVGYTSMMNYSGYNPPGYNGYPDHSLPLFAVLITILALGYIYILRGALRQPALCVLAVLFLPGAMAVLAIMPYAGQAIGAVGQAAGWHSAVLSACGLTAVVNPSLLSLDWDQMYESSSSIGITGWLILAQALTAWALWGIALQAIDQRRGELG